MRTQERTHKVRASVIARRGVAWRNVLDAAHRETVPPFSFLRTPNPYAHMPCACRQATSTHVLARARDATRKAVVRRTRMCRVGAQAHHLLAPAVAGRLGA